MDGTAAVRGSAVSPTPPPQCSIALWRGYVTAQFYARDSNSGGALFLSPTFGTWRLPWQPSVPMRDDPKALEALESLKGELRSRGWARMRREPGSDWYESRFRLGRRPSTNGVGDRKSSPRLTSAVPADSREADRIKDSLHT
jgi:hypothetical protein